MHKEEDNKKNIKDPYEPATKYKNLQRSLSIKENSLVRDVNNTLYFSANILNNDTKTLADVALYSVTNNTINWQYTIEIDNMAQIVTIDNTPVIGADGTIYFGAHINDNLNKRMTAYMYALNPDGTLLTDSGGAFDGNVSIILELLLKEQY